MLGCALPYLFILAGKPFVPYNYPRVISTGIKAFLFYRKDDVSVTARVQIKPGRPNYYIVIDYKDADGKRKIKWVTTDVPIKGNNRRAIEERRKEVLTEYENQDIEAPAEIDLRGDTLFTDFLI